MRIRVQGVVCGVACVALLMIVFALHILNKSDTRDLRSRFDERVNMRGRGRTRDAFTKNRGTFRPVDLGVPVSEASKEYLDTHQDMMPMMRAPPSKTTMEMPESTLYYPLPPPPPPPLPYNF